MWIDEGTGSGAICNSLGISDQVKTQERCHSFAHGTQEFWLAGMDWNGVDCCSVFWIFNPPAKSGESVTCAASFALSSFKAVLILNRHCVHFG